MNTIFFYCFVVPTLSGLVVGGLVYMVLKVAGIE